MSESFGYAAATGSGPERGAATRPVSPQPKQSWLLELQRQAGNSAVAAPVVQRVPLSKDEEYFLLSAGDRLDAAAARAAIGRTSRNRFDGRIRR